MHQAQMEWKYGVAYAQTSHAQIIACSPSLLRSMEHTGMQRLEWLILNVLLTALIEAYQMSLHNQWVLACHMSISSRYRELESSEFYQSRISASVKFPGVFPVFL